MISDSPILNESARKIRARMLNGLEIVTQRVVAERLGVVESTITHWKEEGKQFDSTARFLEAIDMKVVGKNDVMVPPEYLEALHCFTQIAAKLTPAQVIALLDGGL